MNATQIAAEIARLSALLIPTLADDEDWDGDIAAVLGHLADASRDQGVAADTIADMTEDMEDENWETVTYETNRCGAVGGSISRNLRSAQVAAQIAQRNLAKLIPAAYAA